MHWLWVNADALSFECSWCKNKNRWRSVDAHCYEVAPIFWVQCLPIKAADMTIMVWWHSIAVILSMMYDQKLLTLRWRSFVGGGRDTLTSMFAHRGGQYIDDWLMPMHCALSVHEATPKIVDTPLTLIFSRFQQYCPLDFAHKAGRYYDCGVTWLYLPCDYLRCEIKTRWRSVDAHLYEVVPVLSLPSLPIKVANTSIIA